MNREGQKIAHYESYGWTDHKNEHNIIDYDISGWWQKNLRQHKKLHPWTSRKGKWIPEKFSRDIERIIQHDSQKNITSEGGDNLSNQKLTNC